MFRCEPQADLRGGPFGSISHALHRCSCTQQLREELLAESDKILISDPHRDVPLARGFQERPRAVATGARRRGPRSRWPSQGRFLRAAPVLRAVAPLSAQPA
eukprot:8409432-Pyramimonas_sp.AAC.1